MRFGSTAIPEMSDQARRGVPVRPIFLQRLSKPVSDSHDGAGTPLFIRSYRVSIEGYSTLEAQDLIYGGGG